MQTMIFLVGEQSIPNLLPIRAFRPEAALGVFSEYTRKGYERLGPLVGEQLRLWPLKVDAYDICAIQAALLGEIRSRELVSHELLFNITGGTKPMSLAAYLAAQELQAPIIYLQTEGKRTRLCRYEFDQTAPRMVEDQILPGLITIDDYLQAYLGRQYSSRKSVQDDDGHRFEQAIANALGPVLDEAVRGISLKGVVDVDLVVRSENQVGILEAKLGNNHMKQGIDQLNTAGGQTFLGTYTQKFLVSDQNWNAYPDLKELASTRQITIIELPNSRGQPTLTMENTQKVQQAILKGLGKST